MLKKFSAITLLSFSFAYNVSAAENKYGYQLAPNQTLNIDSSEQNITSDADTKNLTGIYYNEYGQTEVNANPLNLKVTNSNTGNQYEYSASGISINNTNSSSKGSLNLGNSSQVSVTADSAYGIIVNNTNLSGSNLNVEANGKYNIEGISVTNSDVKLTGNNTITVAATTGSSGLSVHSNSSFSTDKITLNVNADSGTGISVRDSTADLGTGSSININAGKYMDNNGINLTNGSVTAKDLTIVGASYGVTVANGSFTMNGGSIKTDDRGVQAGIIDPTPPSFFNKIDLTNVDLSTGGIALQMSNGLMILNGVTATSAMSNALLSSPNAVTKATDVVLQSSQDDVIYALGGQVIFSGNTDITALNPNNNAIYAEGGSVTTGSNGSKMKIVGNLSTDRFDAGTIDLKMNSGSGLTGKSTIGSTNGIINLDMTDSLWNMTDSSATTQLALNNSQVNFTNNNDSTLTTNELSGTGTFAMKTDIADQQGDLIKVLGTTTGDHHLAITNQGTGATNGTETLTVVETADGAGKFALTHTVEAGGYLYGLRKADNDTDWELYGLPPNHGGGAQTSSALAGASFLNTSYLLNYVDNQTLLQRLGDLRLAGTDKDQDGFWMRSFGGKLSSFAGSNLSGFDMPYWGTQVGIDKGIRFSSGTLFVGTMAGMTQAKPNYEAGDGNSKNYSLGLYTTYYHDSGLYIDTLLKYNNIHNQFNVKDTAGNGVKGKGRTQGVSGSIEVGKRYWLTNNQAGFYLEPQAQLTLGTQGGDTVKASNGLKIKLDSYNTVLGRTSAIIGYQIQTANPINVYLKTGYMRELSGNTSYKLNGSKEKHNFGGEWWDNGVGVAVTINKVHNLYMDATYATGNKFDQKQLNIGYRYSF